MNELEKNLIMRGIHQKMSRISKTVVFDELLKTGNIQIVTNPIVLNKKSDDLINNTVGKNIQFEKNKQLISVDLVVVKNNVVYLCDMKFTKRAERVQIVKSIESLKMVKEWIESVNPQQEVIVNSFYWGKQKKIKPVPGLLVGLDFCTLFDISLNQVEAQIKNESNMLLKEAVLNMKNNEIGFNMLAGSSEMDKYKTSLESDSQDFLF